jgi:hypothetical protein
MAGSAGAACSRRRSATGTFAPADFATAAEVYTANDTVWAEL